MFLQDFLTLPNAVQPVALALVSQWVHFLKNAGIRPLQKKKSKSNCFKHLFTPLNFKIKILYYFLLPFGLKIVQFFEDLF